MAYIYALYDPRTQRPRHVGQATDPVPRFKAHCAGAKGDKSRRGVMDALP